MSGVFERSRKNALLGRLNRNTLDRVDANSSPDMVKSRYVPNDEDTRSVRSGGRSLSIAPSSA